MKANLMMVVYNVDGNEFLVNAKNNQQAIEKAIKANLNEDIMGKLEEEDRIKMQDPSLYTPTSIIKPWDLIVGLYKQKRFAAAINNVIVLKA